MEARLRHFRLLHKASVKQVNTQPNLQAPTCMAPATIGGWLWRMALVGAQEDESPLLGGARWLMGMVNIHVARWIHVGAEREQSR